MALREYVNPRTAPTSIDRVAWRHPGRWRKSTLELATTVRRIFDPGMTPQYLVVILDELERRRDKTDEPMFCLSPRSWRKPSNVVEFSRHWLARQRGKNTSANPKKVRV